jgi:3-deoxy-7-phosphoheptulonate synthase
MPLTEDINVVSTKPLITPRALKQRLPLTPAATQTVLAGRRAIRDILERKDHRLLVVLGPCSIHDEGAALEYAGRLAKLSRELDDQLCIVMRTYFEKPRTTIGWKGLINDPHLDGSYDLSGGLALARKILIAIAEMGLPTATEVLDPIVPQYISDLLCWASIGARTTESQTHRELASGLSTVVGFKNSTDGNLHIAINAMLSARGPHRFLGIDQDGQTCVVETKGNPWGHIILRGGAQPNYDRVSVAETQEFLEKAGLRPLIMVDCSHANCHKRYELQAEVFKDVVQQRLDGNPALIGLMLESHLHEGNQPLAGAPGQLTYGTSITDPCLGWDATEKLLVYAHERLGEATELVAG